MSILRRSGMGLSFAAMAAATPASAAGLLDCPMRDAPFSISSPLIDILSSDAAKAVVEKHLPGRLAKIPPFIAGTKAPSFASILTLEKIAPMIGAGEAGSLASLDTALRSLDVTEADRIKRCDRYDDERPSFLPSKGKLRVLLFDKITGFRDGPSVAAANSAIRAMADRNGWALLVTDKGGAMHPSILANVDVVLWNNVSGDVLTLTQRRAFRAYMERGGGFVGIHGSAGDPVYFWDWYPDTLIGARFAGHPMDPQFQEARVVVDKAHPLAARLPAEWRMTDEWYSFKTNPRATGAKVILSLDESTYSRTGRFGGNLDMGDHPIAWTRCIGKGRMFYSAIGHLPETYSHPLNVTLLEDAIGWAATKGAKC